MYFERVEKQASENLFSIHWQPKGISSEDIPFEKGRLTGLFGDVSYSVITMTWHPVACI
jgi:hypothetical protein